MDSETFLSHWSHTTEIPDSGNMEQRHHASSHQHMRDTTHDPLHFIAPVHVMQRCTRPSPARTVLPWLYTTACASSSSTQRGFIPADWSKFPPTLKVSQQQRLAAITDDFSRKPGASSPARKVQTILWVPCNTQYQSECTQWWETIFLQPATFHCKH